MVALMLPAAAPAAAVDGCGPTTLSSTIVLRDDGRLTCGPGEATTVRDDLAARSTPTAAPLTLASFVTMANLNIVDEESPARAEFMDRCGTVMPDASRPHEALLPALIEGHVRAISALATTGGPTTGKSYDFAINLGSITENRQRNELDLAFALMNGGGLIDPNSGAGGYEGTQGADPRGAGDLTSPVSGLSLRDLGNARFIGAGLRAGGAPLPWYDVIGIRDATAWGIAPSDTEPLHTVASAIATGPAKINDIGTQHLRRICSDPGLLASTQTWSDLVDDPGAARVVTPDAARAPVTREGWVDAHEAAGGAPTGHGFATGRCTDADGDPLPRACFGWEQGGIRFVALDTTPTELLGEPVIDADQLAWLEEELIATAARYVGDDGTMRTTSTPGRAVVVLSDDPVDRLDGGAQLEALLLRFPNVVAHLSGGPSHLVRPHSDPEAGTGYWEVRTASIADWPSQSRSIEITDNGDGTLSITSVMVDAALPADPRTVRWDADDPTDESRIGPASINEAWLGSAAREIAANDPDVDIDAVRGRAKDRNVELLVSSPLTRAPVLPSLPVDLPSFEIPDFSGPSLPTFEFPTLPSQGIGDGLPAFPQPTVQRPIITGPGLAVLPSAEGGWGGRALRMFGIAAILGTWVARARVRRWMVGI